MGAALEVEEVGTRQGMALNPGRFRVLGLGTTLNPGRFRVLGWGMYEERNTGHRSA